MNPVQEACTLHDHVLATARVRGDAPAVIAAQDTWSWNQLAQHVQASAAVLAATGIEGGERLVIVSENSPATLVLLLAAQTLRAWPAVINARLPHAEALRMIECAEPRLVLFCTADSEAALAHAGEFSAAPLELSALQGIRVLQRTPAIGPQPAAQRADEEIGCLIFTSGTTGKPKAVMHSHGGLLNHGRVVGRARGTRSEDTIELAAPLAHVMGWAGALAALLYGAAMRIRPRLSPSELAAAIARGEVMQASMVPVAWSRLLEQVRSDGLDMSQHQLRVLVSGGAPLDPALKASIEKAFGRTVQNAYGMTEVAPLSRTSGSGPSAPWSVGRPEANVEVRIVDDSGQPVADGEVGEVEARGPCVMTGYFAAPEATAQVMRGDGWLATGDLGKILPDGELAVVGRRKEMIIRGGFNVYPAEVEGTLASHPAVLLAAVVGEPAAMADESVVAYVQLRDPQQESDALRRELSAHVRTALAPYKCPSRIEFVRNMPLGSTGKILKRELRRNE